MQRLFLSPVRNALRSVSQHLKAAADQPCPYWTDYLRETKTRGL